MMEERAALFFAGPATNPEAVKSEGS
jgi:hypothetical protein